MNTKQWIASKIKNRLKLSGLRKRDFARLMNVSAPRVTQWLRGDHNFTIETLIEIEKVLNIKFFAETELDLGRRCYPCVTEKLF